MARWLSLPAFPTQWVLARAGPRCVEAKQAHTCAPQPPTHPPPCHRIPSAHLRSPSTLPFFFPPPSSRPATRRREEPRFCCQPREGEGQAFTSPLPPPIISLICPPPPHAPASPPTAFAFDIQQWVLEWSGVEWSEARAELALGSELSTLQLGEPSALPPVGSLQLKSSRACCRFQWRCPPKV